MKQNGNKIIIGIPAMAGYLNVSEPTIYEYIKQGMPGGKVCGRWHFHIDNVMRWFEVETGKSWKELPAELIMDEKIYNSQMPVNPKKHLKNT